MSISYGRSRKSRRHGFEVDLDRDFRQISLIGGAERFARTMGMLLVLPPANTGDYSDDSVNALYELVLQDDREHLSNLEDDPLPFNLALGCEVRRNGKVKFAVLIEFGPRGREITVTGLYDRRFAQVVDLIVELVDLEIPFSADSEYVDEYRRILDELEAVR